MPTIDLCAHADALCRNYRTAWPNKSVPNMADYVATEMVKFSRAHGAHDAPTDYSTWYAYARSNS